MTYKSCGCFYGACDCGVDYSKEADKATVREFMGSLIPQDLYLLKAQGELFEGPRDYKNDAPNVFYVGEVDSRISLDDIMNKMNLLESYMNTSCKALSEQDKIEYLHDLGRRLADCVSFRSEAVNFINSVFDRRYQRVISDWKKVW